MKKIPLLLIMSILFISLTACSAEEEDPISLLVQGNLDAVYTGTYDESYLELVDLTSEDCAQSYQHNLETEAGYFLRYFGYSDEALSDTVREKIVKLYGKIYANANYTVAPSVKLDKDTRAVKVQVSPIDIFQLAAEDTDRRDNLFAEIQKKYYWIPLDSTDWSNSALYSRGPYYAQCRDECLEALVTLCTEQLPDVGYLDAKTVVVQVFWSDNGYWSIDETDWRTIDSLIIAYP